MTFSSFIFAIITSFLKPLIAIATSFGIAISSVFTGPMGEYMKLQNTPLGFDPVHVGVDYQVSVNALAITTLAGVDLPKENELEAAGFGGIIGEDGHARFNDRFDLYADLTNARFALTFGEADKNFGIYADPTAVAVTPELTSAALSGISAFYPVYPSVYKKHTPDYGFYLDLQELIGDGEVLFSAEEATELMGILEIVPEIYGNIFKSMTEGEGLKAFAEISKKASEASSKYYTETEHEGKKAYTFKMSGKQYLELLAANAALFGDAEFMNSYEKLLDAVMSSIDYAKIMEKTAELSGASEAEKAEMIAAAKEESEKALQEIKAEMSTTLPKTGESIKNICNALITGEGITELFGEQYGTYISLCMPFFNNSHVTSTLYSDNGAVSEDFELCVTNGSVTLATVKYKSVTEKYGAEIATPAQKVPFGKRLTPEIMQNKVGYEKATSIGVESIEIKWDSEMHPEDSLLKITYPEFSVSYKSDASAEGGEEEFYGSVTTSAQLLDGSVYLPLRQLMENAGYEVSWDDAARKAYVTVNGKKIEMTGVIINNKTYVKVRDFEKLGAKVDYVEDIYVANDWNDFAKTCTATINF